MPTKMISLRLDAAGQSNLEYLCKFFECSQADLISDLLGILACDLTNYCETFDKSQLLKTVGMDQFGYEYTSIMYRKVTGQTPHH